MAEAISVREARTIGAQAPHHAGVRTRGEMLGVWHDGTTSSGLGTDSQQKWWPTVGGWGTQHCYLRYEGTNQLFRDGSLSSKTADFHLSDPVPATQQYLIRNYGEGRDKTTSSPVTTADPAFAL